MLRHISRTCWGNGVAGRVSAATGRAQMPHVMQRAVGRNLSAGSASRVQRLASPVLSGRALTPSGRFAHIGQWARPTSRAMTSLAGKEAGVMAGETLARESVPKAVKVWMTGCTGMVFGIIMIGGITRLTESGLSMVDWKLQGSLPPLTKEAWEAEFAKYQQFPEFARLNPNMDVHEFKQIFFWEYLHRMWGRSIGLAFALPFAYFAARGQVTGALRNRCLLLMAGIGCQGLVGWWMVKSGLEEPTLQTDQPRVSQYRLATHLGAAFLLYSGMLWTSLQLWKPKYTAMATETLTASLKTTAGKLATVRKAAAATAGLVFVTAMSGAFVAGLDAGLVYNEFPYMGEGLMPEESWDRTTLPGAAREKFASVGRWLQHNLCDDSATVQFNHRCLGITTATVVTSLFLFTKSLKPALPRAVNKARHAMIGMVALQVALGITTLLTYVPTPIAALHQGGSVVLLSSSLWYLHELRRLPK